MPVSAVDKSRCLQHYSADMHSDGFHYTADQGLDAYPILNIKHDSLDRFTTLTKQSRYTKRKEIKCKQIVQKSFQYNI